MHSTPFGRCRTPAAAARIMNGTPAWRCRHGKLPEAAACKTRGAGAAQRRAGRCPVPAFNTPRPRPPPASRRHHTRKVPEHSRSPAAHNNTSPAAQRPATPPPPPAHLPILEQLAGGVAPPRLQHHAARLLHNDLRRRRVPLARGRQPRVHLRLALRHLRRGGRAGRGPGPYTRSGYSVLKKWANASDSGEVAKPNPAMNLSNSKPRAAVVSSEIGPTPPSA